MTPSYQIELLGPQHDRSGFVCGVPELDAYLAERAGQDVKRRVATCRTALEPGSVRVVGFYTLAAGSIPLTHVPLEMGRRLPRYPAVPIARLGRLAVDRTQQGRGLGAALLWDALGRVARAELGIGAVAVDAKDDGAAAFYRRHGFVPLTDAPLPLVLPLATIVEAMTMP